ncbi:F-box/kelch-repeat protein At1g80440-like [Punica granatum]|uniref:F-box domain-containing protein n=2 Tax=Punica granatum TaxID=22663 RepID=A0A218W0Q4_PUNGR|nr:F-box/kelch-repeat protein At1g80440-like [Punica granatum]OWM66133.1 hypothetical protein CDL15_Pgr015560 [Punica granatum]PKI71105.1 hypothetical protein CRG98_008506 [Punica granatum]
MELIPGLPNDVARECLVRIPYEQVRFAASICKGWKKEIESPEFRDRRKAAGLSGVLVILAQARPSLIWEFDSPKHVASLTYRLSVFQPLSGQWSTLPPIPGFTAGLPMFCALAAAGSELVVMGGTDPVMWDALNSVYIYNFLSLKWRPGTDMPGGIRTSFSCASDGNRMVYVAGGCGGQRESLKSALVYDVKMDKWVAMPDMARERAACKGTFRCGRFQVIGGYPTELQGRFEKSVEVFDPVTWCWQPVQENVLEVSTYPGTCVDGNNTSKSLYMCMNGNVIARNSSGWRDVAKLPSKWFRPVHVARWHEKLTVVGSDGLRNSEYMAHTLDLNTYSWTRIEIPETFSGHVMGGCCLEI